MIFFKKKPDIEFKDTTRIVYPHLPIQKASDVKPKYFQEQKNKYDRLKFSLCPGMFDQYKAGYIIPAWVDIHIKANKAGTTTILGGARHPCPPNFHQPRPMDPTIVDGIFKPEGIEHKITHIGAPWSIFTKKNISAFILPATFHSDFLDDLYVWPGIVDYKKFTSVNFIFSPKRACEVHIKAGDPLLHVIPFYNKEIKASYGPATEYENDFVKNIIVSGSTNQYYRKNMQEKKLFWLNENDNRHK